MLQSTVKRPTSLGQPESALGLYSFLAEAARASLRPAMLFGFLGVATLSLSLAYAMMQFRDLFTDIGSLGYAAIFLVEAGNSAVILVPTPGPAYTAAMATVLNPPVIGIVGGVGAALGEMVGYTLGATGRHAIEGSRIYTKFNSLAERRFGIAIFAFAAFPLPFDIAGIWASMSTTSGRSTSAL
jgi:membrane protein YqaA with SNARE-associated domain